METGKNRLDIVMTHCEIKKVFISYKSLVIFGMSKK